MSKSQKGGSSPIFGVKMNYKSNSKQHFYITISLGVLIQIYEILQSFFVTLISNPYWQIRKNKKSQNRRSNYMQTARTQIFTDMQLSHGDQKHQERKFLE